jgi:glycosyltransferase involved in cell wall biosynthesis
LEKLKINIVLPFFEKSPGGGLKIMYQYANQFALNGHDVVVYHSMYTSWTHKGRQIRKYKHILFQKYLWIKRKRNPSWYQLHPSIKSFEIVSVKDSYIRNADIIFCTWWATAIEVSELNISKGKKFNLIQDYEIIMTTHKDLVHKSYQIKNLNHICISNYLADVVLAISDKRPPVIPNAIDTKQCFIETIIKDRNPQSICMLYADAERKGSVYGIEALKIVAQKRPGLEVNLFGVYKHPKIDFPDTFNYHHLPDNIRSIYNESAIFISPSIQEGLALPPMEAMACGCACVCTNIGGHVDCMTDNSTALLVNPGNPFEMAERIIGLLEDNEMRIRLSQAGYDNIKHFTWERSRKQLEDLFYQVAD